MLESFFLEGTKNSPEINLNQEEGEFAISGRSIVENPEEFYMSIYEWIEKYVENPNPSTDFKFDLEYFNSSSARQVMKIIILLEKIQEKEDKDIKVTWLYEEGDEMSCERGEEIKAVSKLNFEIKEYPADDAF